MSLKTNKKVIILIGLPGSGKSTWAKKYLSNNPDTIRVNRDDFRLMLKNQQLCENKVENLITKLQDNSILSALNSGFNVIVDNTNCKLKYIEHTLELVKHKADVEFLLLDVGVKKAKEQNSKRENPVPDSVIDKMDKDLKLLKDTLDFSNRKIQKQKRHLELVKYNPELQDAIIVDFDNTLSFLSDRSPYDWKLCINDYPNYPVIEEVGLHQNLGRKVIILSGRDEICRKESETWLEKYDITYDYFYMRKNNDFRKDSIVKKEIYDNHIKNKYNVVLVLDDRQQVVDIWRSLGLTVFQVNESPD